LDRYASADEDGRTAEDSRIGVDDLIRHDRE
jgi:hypothetical protein